MKSELIILIGASGSGKTTLAKRLSELDSKWVVISTDEFRLKEYGVVNWLHKPNHVFSSVEKRVFEELANGHNVIYDACNITFRRRLSLFHRLKPIRKKLIITGLVFHVNIQKCIEQDKSLLRTHHVGALTIIGMKFVSFCNSPKLAEGFDYLTYPARFLHDRYNKKSI